MKHKKGYVYVIQFESGKVKIGISVQPKKRFRTLENSSGTLIEKRYISEINENYKEVEKEAKKEYKSKNILGEYYDVSFDELVEYVENKSKVTILNVGEQNEVKKIIDEKGIINKQVYDEMEMKESKFYRKLRRNQWTKSEKLHLEKILKVKFEH